MHPDVEKLLVLQERDVVISELQGRIDAFAPIVKQLDDELRAARADVEKARAALDAGERGEREIQGRLAEQKALHERNVAQLDAVTRPREASAAMTQVEISRRFVHDTETSLQAAVSAVVDARARLRESESRLAAMEASQSAARADVQAQIAALQQEMADARSTREEASRDVRSALLQKYDRIRGKRRVRALYAIRDHACGNCDTALPIQRRNEMMSSGMVEACEVCGVLLYATE